MPTKLDYALKEIQEWRDAREYGFRSQVESGLKFSRFGAIVFPSSKERECYYDCLSGSYEARNILSKHGIDSKVEEGKDCLSLFVLHYWLRTESGLVVDPCPMFPLVEADHKTNTEIFDLDLEIKWNSTMPNGQSKRCVSIEKAKNIINFNPKTSLEEGLKSTIEWYKNSHN